LLEGEFGHSGQVAQLVEHVTENHGVGGSIPSLATTMLKAKAAESFSGCCFYLSVEFMTPSLS
jgi:hypothetical protein